MASSGFVTDTPTARDSEKKNLNEAHGKSRHFPVDDEMHSAETTEEITLNAKNATEKEHSMTLMQGIRLYPKAIAWSMLISTCIAMEGYDVCLINNVSPTAQSYKGRYRSLTCLLVLRVPAIQPQIRRLRCSNGQLPDSGSMASRPEQRRQRGRDDRSNAERLGLRTFWLPVHSHWVSLLHRGLHRDILHSTKRPNLAGG